MDYKQYLKESAVFDRETSEYQIVSDRLNAEGETRILHSLIGLQTEVGELFDSYKRAWFYGKEIDIINVLEELGDIQWYYALLIRELGHRINMDPDEMQQMICHKNIEKLTERMGKKFSEQSVLNRNLDAERKILETMNNFNKPCECGSGGCSCDGESDCHCSCGTGCKCRCQ